MVTDDTALLSAGLVDAALTVYVKKLTRIFPPIPHKHSSSSLLGCSRTVYWKVDVCRKESLKPEDKMKQVSYEDIFISFHSLHLIHLSSLLSFHLVYLSSTVFSCPQPLLPLLLLPSSSVVGASPPAASTPSMTLQSELLFNYSRVNSIVSYYCVNVGVSVWWSL